MTESLRVVVEERGGEPPAITIGDVTHRPVSYQDGRIAWPSVIEYVYDSAGASPLPPSGSFDPERNKPNHNFNGVTLSYQVRIFDQRAWWELFRRGWLSNPRHTGVANVQQRSEPVAEVLG